MRCETCDCELTRRWQKKYCSRSCSAKKNNLGVCRNGKTRPVNLCTNCQSPTKNQVFCGRGCMVAHGQKPYVARWKAEGTAWNGLKKHLMTFMGDKCQVCGIEDWQDAPITIELEHKDGNSDHNDVENLTLLCPNCHSQTPTYKSKNNGNGRHNRRARYAAGKSY